ncbi:Lon protease [Spirochaetia bacterium]|nr:Lon protease [Spirochaetia bacterium]
MPQSGISKFLSALGGKSPKGFRFRKQSPLPQGAPGKGSALFNVKELAEEFPLLPLRDLVLFPNTVIPIFITYKSGVNAVEESLKRDKRLFAACLKPEGGETYPTGTVVRIIQHLKLPDNTFRVVLQGEYRALIRSLIQQDELRLVRVEPVKITGLKDIPIPSAPGFPGAGADGDTGLDTETAALLRTLQKSFTQYAELSKKISTDTITAVEKTENTERLANLICNAIAVKAEKKLELLSIGDETKRLEAILETLERENEIFGIQKNITGKVKGRMEKNQREYILHEQLKEINKELGKDTVEDEFADVEKAIEEKNPPPEVMAKARKEITRLRKLQSMSPEAGVLRGYLEWISDLPWSEYSPDSVDLAEAEKILDEDHFDMRKAKERILEFIAVRQLTANLEQAGADTPGAIDASAHAEISQPVNAGTEAPAGRGEPGAAAKVRPEQVGIKGPILCFVGPPGTGKTSLGKSVARALGRRFVRISLGGVRDEAEIRGHRKTYVGALPGKIIQSMRKAGAMNPVFLLDEIDKLSSDFRGDPASALLEVLDPEQNSSFTDHYMEVPYDLSKVLFITTANSLHTIPYPLFDRMEIIEVPGYGENEKLAIAKQFLVPKELAENSLGSAKITFKDEALLEIIRHWTMESGVRSLKREIARCIRRIAREAVKKDYGKDPEKPVRSFKKTIHREDLEKLLGRRKYKNDVVFKEARIGVTYGLAWTEVGGTMLPVETIRFEGNGELIMTGNLGDVMKESARIALSWLRSAHERYNFLVEDVGKTDFHIHVPEGAIPKDGPSAGITLAASLLSTLCQIPPRPGIAMTGELTLTGRILPIGGLKEKLLAAIRNGMEKVLLPADNRDDWEELDKEVRDAIAVEFVENADETFKILFDGGILRKMDKNHPKEAKKPAGNAKKNVKNAK